MHAEIQRPYGGGKVFLRETKRAVTPFGGLVVLVQLIQRLGVMGWVREHLPFVYRSPNQIEPEVTLLAFWLAVCAGARRFAHVQGLRCDEALRQVCGIARLPTDDTVRNFFRRFKQAEVERFFAPLWRKLFAQLPARRCTLDLDSTVFQRYGEQEGAKCGYNPVRHGGATHHPLFAVLAEPVLVLHSWLRSGDSAPNRGAVAFLQEALSVLPEGWSISGVRADGGFFDQKLLSFFEEKALPYVVVVRMHSTLQTQVHAVEHWHQVGERHWVGEFELQLQKWSRPRRFIVVKEQLPPRTPRRALLLLDVPGYAFRVFVTNRTEAPEWLWRHYDERAAIEPRFSEIKTDLAADDFCLKQFFATEAVLRSVVFLFNLLSILQKAQPAQTACQRPATLRSSIFTCGAIVGRCSHTTVLFMAESWGGLKQRIPILRNIAQGDFLTSPKLPFTEPFPAPG
jgi:hypothetical protein